MAKTLPSNGQGVSSIPDWVAKIAHVMGQKPKHKTETIFYIVILAISYY